MRHGGIALVILMLFAGPSAGHVPQVGPGDRVIEEPARSWAFYDELSPGDTHVWTFDLQAGDPLFIHVAVPTQAAWTPEATLSGPAGVVALERAEGDIGLEPFTPYASRDAWRLVTTAPASGTYALAITGEGGPYAFGYGLAEVFSPVEWTMVPVQAALIHQWEGQSVAWLALPYLLALAGVLAWWAWKRDTSRLAPRVVATLFIASGVERLVQLAIAAQAGAEASAGGWVLAATLALPALALGAAAWRARRAWAFAVIALAGLATWAGLLMGPLIALAVALSRAWDARATSPRVSRVGRGRPRA